MLNRILCSTISTVFRHILLFLEGFHLINKAVLLERIVAKIYLIRRSTVMVDKNWPRFAE
jgi:hypothetical protein